MKAKVNLLRGVVAAIIVATIAVAVDYARANIIRHLESIPTVIAPGSAYPPLPDCKHLAGKGTPREYADCILTLR